MKQSRLNYLTIMGCGIYDKLHTTIILHIKVKDLALEFAHFHDLVFLGVHMFHFFDTFFFFLSFDISFRTYPIYIF